jgi:hypothetical protein
MKLQLLFTRFGHATSLSDGLLAALGLGSHGGSARGGTLGAGDQRSVDMGDNTTTSDGGLDEGVKLLVSADSQQQVSGGDSLHLQVLAGVTGQLQNLSGQVLQDSRSVYSGGSTDSLRRVHAHLQESVDTTNRELQTSSGRSRLGGSLRGGLATLATLTTLTTLAALTTFASNNIHFDK